jgi:2-aminoethylphosphonate-pyruvate transaminase
MNSDRRDPVLLTPGPLTTARVTKQAMLRDWGSRDTEFVALSQQVCSRLLEIAGNDGNYVCVPLQGSGTFAVEAMIGTFVPSGGKLLVLVNGAYGHRIDRICGYLNLDFATYEVAEDETHDASRLDALLDDDPTISHVAVVHCETTSGILNPVSDLAEVVHRHNRCLLLDAVSSFGALPIDCGSMRFGALALSANKCLEGVPGLAFVICRRDLLEASAGNARSLSLDLNDQWQAMGDHGQWRFTPPTQVIAAFHQALLEHADEGGVERRRQRYTANCQLLVEGMRKLGFETLLRDEVQAPIIVTFHMPADSRFEFKTFYDGLRAKGYVIYPGKLAKADSFRIGCIGHLGTAEIEGALVAVGEMLKEMKLLKRDLLAETATAGG